MERRGEKPDEESATSAAPAQQDADGSASAEKEAEDSPSVEEDEQLALQAPSAEVEEFQSTALPTPTLETTSDQSHEVETGDIAEPEEATGSQESKLTPMAQIFARMRQSATRIAEVSHAAPFDELGSLTDPLHFL